MKLKPTIIKPKLRGKTDSFFYEGQVACVSVGNHHYSLEAGGDIQVIIDDEIYPKKDRDVAIKKHKLTDKKLRKLEDCGRLGWNMNNWFTIIKLDLSFNVVDDDGPISHDYDEGIATLIEYALEENKQGLIE